MSPDTARAMFGACLLLRPQALLRVAPGGPPSTTLLAFARLLGIRHLLQALILERHPTRTQLRIGATVDALHASSMLGLALMQPRRRRLAFANFATASAFALAGLRRAARLTPTGRDDQRSA